MTIERLAFDRASVRTIDGNGRLQIAKTNISKANVCPYYGKEIPNYEKLGLEPDKIYQLYRHPDELKKAAHTFNNIPVLNRHVPDFPSDPPREFRVGATHSNCEFDGTYLTVGMTIYDESAMAGIETREQRELSASYQYVADMTPGVTPDGVPYDGIMRNIVGNHEALVPEGRAGSDVLVADSLPSELIKMAKAEKRLAILKPFLAQDADIEALKRLLASDEAEEKKTTDDEDEDEDEEEEKKKKTAEDSDDDDDDDDDKKKKTADDEDEDDDDDKKDDKVSKTAMDSAIRLAAESATKLATKCAAENFRKIREAEQVVRPLIGDVIAMDSADDVYRTALEQSGVDIKGIHPSAFPALVQMAISQKQNSRPAIAQDSASISDFEKAFPTAGKLKRG